MTGEERAKQDREDARALIRTREGARFFARLLELCGVNRLSYTPGDTHATAFKEGQRNVGNAVLSWLSEAEDLQERLSQGAKEREVGEDDGE